MQKTLFLESADIEIKGGSSQKKGLRISGFANTSNKDRVGDVVLPAAWIKGIESYRRNPILLNQHKHDQPIGRVEKIQVSDKGIFVDAIVTDTAEQQFQTHSLIKDKVLRAFSVGFRPLNAKYDRKTDTTFITDLELHEISIVSVPANRESLFRIRKNFDSENDYKDYLKSLVSEGSAKNKELCIYAGIGSKDQNHYHTFEVDQLGNGKSTYTSHKESHDHEVKDWKIQDAEGHSHTVTKWVETEKTMAVEIDMEDISENEEVKESSPVEPSKMQEEKDGDNSEQDIPNADFVSPKEKENSQEEEEKEELELEGEYTPVPFINLLSIEANEITKGSVIRRTDSNARMKVKKVPTNDSPSFVLQKVDINNQEKDGTLTLGALQISILNTWDLNSEFDLYGVIHPDNRYSYSDTERKKIKDEFNATVGKSLFELHTLKEREDIVKDKYFSSRLNTLINLKLSSQDWSDIDYVIAKRFCESISGLKTLPESTLRNKALETFGYKIENTKENENMATQEVDTPLVVNTNKSESDEPTPEVEKASQTVEKEEKSPRIVVDTPRAEKLVQETGKKILEAASKEETTSESEELKELKAQIKKYTEVISAIQESKMVYSQNNRKEQFTNKEMANALFLAKALGREDPFNTKLGAKMKAVTTVASFLTNFSTTVFEEMQQQLVIAPMLPRVQVNAKNFDIPVGDEDTDGDVAQFANGTYATGPYDSSNVPTTNQHTIKNVSLTPHKFMATTHLAKDEEEDTVLPLIDYLRAAAARRLARAIDKALLRGDGSLSGFTASPTNAISAGSGYASVLKGITKLCTDVGAGLQVDVGANDYPTPTDIASARTKLGKYGLQLGDQLVFLTTIAGYNDLIQTSDFQTVDKFGPNATYLTGSLGAVYGIPVVVTEFLDVTGTSSDHVGLLVYKPGFVIGERRAMEVESEYRPRQQVTAVYMSTRFDMKALTTVASAALSAVYSYAVLLRSA